MMKLKSISEEEIETMSYDDIAYVILKEKGKKMKLLDLFNEVIDQLKLNKEEAENHLADFFSLLSTEKRFIQLDKGFWDLRENHTSKVELSDIEEDDEEDEIEVEEEQTPEEDEMYIDETKESDDDEVEDEYKDLVVIDDDMESEL
ncbi:MAG: DNA-directed RNA polymerase subunit delta [Tenericutes bacterium]|nr:DNA-directed RNA polymerase subunit delta [Mycoplasmatota bacterium]